MSEYGHDEAMRDLTQVVVVRSGIHLPDDDPKARVAAYINELENPDPDAESWFRVMEARALAAEAALEEAHEIEANIETARLRLEAALSDALAALAVQKEHTSRAMVALEAERTRIERLDALVEKWEWALPLEFFAAARTAIQQDRHTYRDDEATVIAKADVAKMQDAHQK